ncbi:unnamed protein product (mitochondrion) [Plasmodiophora brassicae]|uniref:Uncharacterized protein n=1 Tax=Plasmodiophora brassicae TaxID=37360 RepID=A0A3P3YAW3_PLABS|nr:unnamed protein product [Plasmodiophora brassicae]
MSALGYDGADDDASYDDGLFSKLMARMAMQEEEEENAVPRNPRTWPSVDQSDNWLTKPLPQSPALSEPTIPGKSFGEDFLRPNLSADGEGDKWAKSLDLPPAPTLERFIAPPRASPDRHLLEDKAHLERRMHDLEIDLQSALSRATDLQRELETARGTIKECAKFKEERDEVKRLLQAAQDDHAVAEQKWQASISKAERIRSRLEAEIARHTDSIRGLTEENARLRSTIEEAGDETELVVQRERENWARAEALRTDELKAKCQRLQGIVDASAARDGSGTGTLALEAELSDLREALRAARFANRERDMEVAEMTIKLRDLKTQYSQCSSLLETQQRDNEQLVQKIEELQEARRDNYAETGVQTISTPCTETPYSVKRSPAPAEDNQGMLSQEALYDLVRQAITSETEKFKSQLVSLCEKYESVHQLLERQSRKQENIQETIGQLEHRISERTKPDDSSALNAKSAAASAISLSDPREKMSSNLARAVALRRRTAASAMANDDPVRLFFVAFLSEMVDLYPDGSEWPITFEDFSFVYESFQSSNRKIRSTVVELIDFTIETALKYLSETLSVVTVADNHSLSWNVDRVFKVASSTKTRRRKQWGGASNSWDVPAKPAPPSRPSRPSEMHWGGQRPARAPTTQRQWPQPPNPDIKDPDEFPSMPAATAQYSATLPDDTDSAQKTSVYRRQKF